MTTRPWDYAFSNTTYKNQALSTLLYNSACDYPCFLHQVSNCPVCTPPLSNGRRWAARCRLWWRRYRPHIHLGPCSEEWE